MLELSLYQLESQLADLIEMRESAADEAEIAVLDAAIAQYLRAEVTKVDGVRAFWRHCETMIEAAKRERDAQNMRIQQWQQRLDRLKRTCCMVMEAMPWREGKSKKLEGRTGALLLKTNGGKQAVEITDQSLIPEEFCTVTVTMSLTDWRHVEERFAFPPLKASPSLGAIAEALERPCEQCEGVWPKCSACGGTGKNGVPGARLVPRGNHVECK